MDDKLVETVGNAIVKQETLNEQVQSFVYDDLNVIRDLLLPYGEQELFQGGGGVECRQVLDDIKSERIARAAIQAHTTYMEENGLCVVPREPTEAMVACLIEPVGTIYPSPSNEEAIKGDWRDMLSAAQKEQG